jgi:hypothetical protein
MTLHPVPHGPPPHDGDHLKAERLYLDFRTSAVADVGERLLLDADDALALVSEAADDGVPVIALDGLRLEADGPTATEHAVDFSADVAVGHGCWAQAEAFLRARRRAGLAWEVTLGDDPLEVV